MGHWALASSGPPESPTCRHVAYKCQVSMGLSGFGFLSGIAGYPIYPRVIPGLASAIPGYRGLCPEIVSAWRSVRIARIKGMSHKSQATAHKSCGGR